MNIFEQYGIKEVADVTLYGITYDKYDNEVYIPVMYFDTLKVSTIEQSAGQASARGGLGNTEHVIWDFGKEISVNLQDALYTPSSQNLLWGGTYGLKNMKIKGYWIPYTYDGKDVLGNIEYVEKQVTDNPQENPDEWVDFICPCDDSIKYVRYVANVNKGQIVKSTNLTRGDKDIVYPKSSNEMQNLSSYFENNFSENLMKKSAEIQIQNFEDFKEELYNINEENGRYELIENIDDNKFTRIGLDDLAHRVLEYRWTNCDIKMVTDNDEDIAYMKNITFCYHSQYNNNNKRFYFISTNDNGFTIFNSSIEFNMEIKKYIVDSNGEEKPYIFIIPVGRFYIVEDRNYNTPEEEYAIYQIDNHLKKVKYLDSLVKLIAVDTFAINTDINLESYQRFEIDKYKKTPIQCFLDPKTMKPFESNSPFFKTQKGNIHYGNLCIIKKGEPYYKYVRQCMEDQKDKGQQIIVNAKTFPGAFRLVGETYIKDRFGEEKALQIDIPLCKLSSNTNLTLQADGEPTTVDMQLKVLRKRNGTMMKLTYHDIIDPCLTPEAYYEKIPPIAPIEVTLSTINKVWCVPYDCRYSGHRQGEPTSNKGEPAIITPLLQEAPPEQQTGNEYKNIYIEVKQDGKYIEGITGEDIILEFSKLSSNEKVELQNNINGGGN